MIKPLAQSLFKTEKYQIQILLMDNESPLHLSLGNLSECVCERERENESDMLDCLWFQLANDVQSVPSFSDAEGRVSPIEVHLF